MKKIKVPIVIFSIILILIPVVLGGIILYYTSLPDNTDLLDNTDFNFYINETGEILEGDVYFEDIQSKNRTYLGRTNLGHLEYDSYQLYPGDIIFISNYESIPLEYTYSFTKEDLESRHADYIITEKDLKDLLFSLDREDIETSKKEIFDLINYARTKSGIEILTRDTKLDKIAQDYSQRMQTEVFYAHTDPGGYDVYDRLKKENIFHHAATENLNLNFVYSDTKIAEDIVYGWIESPGHRVPILDTNKPPTWNNIGIGLSCSKLNTTDDFYTCYSVALFAGFNTHIINEPLKKDYIQLIELYPEDLGLDFVTTATIDFRSSVNAKLIFTSDKMDFDRYVNRENLKGELFREKAINSFNRRMDLSPGDSLLIHAEKKAIIYDLEIKYNE